MTTLSTYLGIANNLSTWQAMIAKQPAVQTADTYFSQNIGKATKLSDFINNPRLFNFAMTAYGLGDMTYAKGLMTKVLQQGTSSSTALAHTLNNPNILAFAKAFDSSLTSVVSTVIAKYNENQLETEQGQQNPGVKLALYFQQNATNITSAYSILADKNLLSVVQTALGIDSSTGLEPLDTQAAMITKQLNVADFKDPKKLQAFIERFAANYDANNGGNNSSSLANTLFGQNSNAGSSNNFGNSILTAANPMPGAAPTNAANAVTLLNASTNSNTSGFSMNLLTQMQTFSAVL